MDELMKILRKDPIDKTNLFQLIPELLPCETCIVNHPAHKYNVINHSLAAAKLVDTALLKTVLLLHDIGKPDSLVLDEERVYGEEGNKKPVTHFWGHPEKSIQIAAPILDRLNVDPTSKKAILGLIKYHDTKIESIKDIKSICDEIGAGQNGIKMLLTVQRCDLLTHSDWYSKKKMQLIDDEYHLYEEAFNLNQR